MALVGKLHWDNPAVLQTTHTWLTMSGEELKQLVQGWREMATESIKHHWAFIAHWEKMLYGQNSYFIKK
jgi:hypothetical protein